MIEKFEARLHNWGMYQRQGQGGGNSSPTYEVCRRMAVEAGREITDGFREISPRPEIDEDDAQIIEWCWCQAAYRMDRKHHALLRAHYVAGADPRMVCRVLQIRHRSYDAERQAAVRRFGQVVELLESCKLAQPA